MLRYGSLMLLLQWLCVTGLQIYYYRQPRQQSPSLPAQSWEVDGLATWISSSNFFDNLDCNTTSNDGAGISWTGQVPINRYWILALAKGKRLALESFTDANLGIYTCYDSATNESLTVNITSANPAIQAVSDAVTIEEGSSGQLKVYVSGIPNPNSTDITWFKVGPGGSRTELKEPTVNFSSDHRTLLLTNVQQSDGGLYECLVNLSILTPPSFASSTIYVRIERKHVLETTVSTALMATPAVHPPHDVNTCFPPTVNSNVPTSAPPDPSLTETKQIIIAMGSVTGICILTVILMLLGLCLSLHLGRQRIPIEGSGLYAENDIKRDPFYGTPLEECNYTSEPAVQGDHHCNCPQRHSPSCWARDPTASAPTANRMSTCSRCLTQSGRPKQAPPAVCPSPYAIPLVEQDRLSHSDATPTPYLTPCVLSTDRKLPQPPQYEDVERLRAHAQCCTRRLEITFSNLPPSSISSRLKNDVQPYATVNNSEILLVAETEV